MTVSSEEWHRSYAKYCTLTKAPMNGNTARRFYKFLGITVKDNQKSFSQEWTTVQTSDTAIQRIKWLNGPNAEILYKMWKAQNNDAA